MEGMKLGRVLHEIDMGGSVLCDWCNTEFEGSEEKGGFMFGTYATCPRCAPGMQAKAEANDETHMIRERCPPGMTFHAWIMELRGGNNTIRHYELIPE